MIRLGDRGRSRRFTLRYYCSGPPGDDRVLQYLLQWNREQAMTCDASEVVLTKHCVAEARRCRRTVMPKLLASATTGRCAIRTRSMPYSSRSRGSLGGSMRADVCLHDRGGHQTCRRCRASSHRMSCSGGNGSGAGSCIEGSIHRVLRTRQLEVPQHARFVNVLTVTFIEISTLTFPALTGLEDHAIAIDLMQCPTAHGGEHGRAHIGRISSFSSRSVLAHSFCVRQ